MALTGIDPNNPRPAIRREFVFGAGPTLGQAPDRPVLLFGNKTAAGSETVHLIGEPIRDAADCVARFGIRSELFAMYRAFTSVPQEATIYGIAVTESGGTAAAVVFTISGASDNSNTYEFHAHGQYFQVAVQAGDSQETVATAIAAGFNAGDDGRLQMTAVAAIDGAGPNWKVTVTYSHKGPRGNLIMGSTTDRGLRVKKIGTNTQTVVKNNASYVAGATDDDFTAAIAEAAQGEYYYQITPHQRTDLTTAPTSTDNGMGEHLAMIIEQSLPINAKDQVLIGGLVCNYTESKKQSEGLNSVFCKLFHQENSDWSPGMIAAHFGAIVRQQEIKYPAANINSWRATDNQIMQIPVPYLKADWPTNGEIVSDLNHGVSPISVVGGRCVLERHITAKHTNAFGSYDYRTREGHIVSVVHFFWALARQAYESIRQPNADHDPVGQETPPKMHTTPSSIRAMLEILIDDLASDAPLGGKYRGAILKRSAVPLMKSSITVLYDNAGGFPTSVDIQSVQHNIKWEAVINETGASY